MPGCSSCGGGRAKIVPPSQPPAGFNLATASKSREGMVEIECIAEGWDTTRAFIGKKTSTQYRFASTEGNRRRFVFAADVDDLLKSVYAPGKLAFRVVEMAPAGAPKPVQPLAVRDRQIPAAAATAQPKPAQPPRVSAPLPPKPTPQPVVLSEDEKPRMVLKPVPKAPWQVDAERKEAQARGQVVAPVMAKEEGAPPPSLEEIAPMGTPLPMADAVVLPELNQPVPFAEASAAQFGAANANPAIVKSARPPLDMAFQDFRNALPTLTNAEAAALLTKEKRGKNRNGYVKLLETHIAATA